MPNHLLEALPNEMQELLERRSERVSLRRGNVLHHPGQTIRHLYFPLTCLVSVTVTMKEGTIAEAGAVGNREMVGINAFMGGAETNQTKYVVQVEGNAIKVEAKP